MRNFLTIICVTVIVLTLPFAMVIAQDADAVDVVPDSSVIIRTARYKTVQTQRGDHVAVIEPRLRPFYHGVASGDPLTDRVILWTRVTPENSETVIPVEWFVALDTGFTRIVRRGQANALVDNDFTIKVDADSLQPGTVYYYTFLANNRWSLIGRTRTLSESQAHVRLAVVSCANYPAGFFNAYGAIAARNDLDGILHLGDYIYEYSADSTSYSGRTGIALDRKHEPGTEVISLVDYRTRYSQYRLDADLRAFHQQHPVFYVWDDHEFANNAYEEGAENHQPSEGDWELRKQISKKVCYEWMPIRVNSDSTIYRTFSMGALCDVYMMDTRMDGRDKQVYGVGENASQTSKDSLNNPHRRMISPEQYKLFTDRIGSSKTPWRVMANQVVFCPVKANPLDTAYLFTTAGPVVASFLRPQLPQLQSLADLAFTIDTWSNYPAQRNQLLDFLKQADVKNTIITTGDFHTSFAFDGSWTNGLGTLNEFLTPSVTSANFDENLVSQPILTPLLPVLLETISRTVSGLNPHSKWMDLVHHGYMILNLTPSKAQCDWYFMDTILAPNVGEKWARGYTAALNVDGLTQNSLEHPGKTVLDVPAPHEPPSVVASVDEMVKPLTVLSFGPNPATDLFYTSFIIDGGDPSTEVALRIVNNSGLVVMQRQILVGEGLNSVSIDLREIQSGTYTLMMEGGRLNMNLKVVVVK